MCILYVYIIRKIQQRPLFEILTQKNSQKIRHIWSICTFFMYFIRKKGLIFLNLIFFRIYKTWIILPRHLQENNLWLYLWDKYIGPSVTRTSETYDTGKQIESNMKKHVCSETFSDEWMYDRFFASSPPSLQICKGQKIENTRPTLILILRKKENPQSTNSFSSFPQYILYSLQNGIQYSHHC